MFSVDEALHEPEENELSQVNVGKILPVSHAPLPQAAVGRQG